MKRIDRVEKAVGFEGVLSGVRPSKKLGWEEGGSVMNQPHQLSLEEGLLLDDCLVIHQAVNGILGTEWWKNEDPDSPDYLKGLELEALIQKLKGMGYELPTEIGETVVAFYKRGYGYML